MGRPVKIISPYKITKIVFERNYPEFGYIYRRELADCAEMGVDDMEMSNCYSLDSGDYIGNQQITKMLCRKRGLRQIQKADPMDCVASIGYDKKEKKWAGWSHRAICSFGIGDKIFEEVYGDDHTPSVRHGSKTIRNGKDAKLSAIRFARHIS